MAMWSLWCHIFLLSALLAYANCQWFCTKMNLTDTDGPSECYSDYTYFTGFIRGDNGGNADSLARLKQAECCRTITQWENSDVLVQTANWWNSFNNDGTWNSCPSGYFLNGYFRSKGDSFLNNIEEGHCVKPAEHPDYYESCYNENITSCFDKPNRCTCKQGYYITALHRGNCKYLRCLDSFRCCTMVQKPEALDSIQKVKDRIMAKSLRDMAYLAHVLGYGWCGGCRTGMIGEGFEKQGDEWRGSTVGPCEGYMSGTRLAIEYADWSWAIKEMKYGDPVYEDLKPETVDTGTLYNNDAYPVTKSMKRTDESVRTVSHSTTDEWKQSHEIGLEFSYTPGGEKGGYGVKASYKFSYEKSSSTTNSNQKEDKKSFEMSTEKTLGPRSAAKWKVLMYKSRTTVPYTATIIVRFSAKFKGFLRWGGGYNGDSTNYHIKYRGSEDRPVVPYKFGDASTPFYTALKQQAKTNAQPWMWLDVMTKYDNAKSMIERLGNEDLYVFTLSGKFEDVIGTKVDVVWDEITPGRGRSSDEPESDAVKHMVHVAKAGPDDPPAPSPEPPVIAINEVAPLDLSRIPDEGS